MFDVAKGDMILAGSKMRFESKNVQLKMFRGASGRSTSLGL